MAVSDNGLVQPILSFILTFTDEYFYFRHNLIQYDIFSREKRQIMNDNFIFSNLRIKRREEEIKRNKVDAN